MVYVVNESIVLDTDRQTISVHGISYHINGKETCLLKILIENRDTVCSYDKILSALYGENNNGIGRGGIASYICKIKSKTQQALDEYIINHTGNGYEFCTVETQRSNKSTNYSIEHINIDNDYYVHRDSIDFIKHFTSKVTTHDGRDIYSIHFRVTWFPDEEVVIVPLSGNVQSVDERAMPDTNRNYNIVFNEPIANGQIVEYVIKVTCSNRYHHFQDFFSTQVIVPIQNLHIHLHCDDELKPEYYSTQVLSDSLNNEETEAPIKHEYFCPSHWHIVNPKLHFEYKLFW